MLDHEIPPRAGQIVAALLPRLGGSLPENYMTFDLETSGLDRERDLILEWGHCTVRDRKVVDEFSCLINWYQSDVVPASWLDDQLARLSRHMELSGRSWRITPELLRKEGVAPRRAMQFISNVLDAADAKKLLYVSHNGWNFDSEMVVSALTQDYERAYTFAADGLLDTGAVVKAAQIYDNTFALPRPGETLQRYSKRIIARPVSAKWNLDRFCARVFALHAQGIEADKMHTAGEDTRALVHLMESFRHWAQVAAAQPRVAPAAQLAPARREAAHDLQPDPAPVRVAHKQRNR